jgi:hypothetical protein
MWRLCVSTAALATGCSLWLDDPATPSDETRYEIRRISELATAANDDDPSLTGDLLEMYFNRSSDIYRSTRSAPGDAWGQAELVVELDVEQEETPEVTHDGLTIYFSRYPTADDPDGYDIMVATRPDRNSAWQPAVAAEGLSAAAAGDYAAAPNRDQTLIVLHSNRDDAGGVDTGDDLYIASRPSDQDIWDQPRQIAIDTFQSDHQGFFGPDDLTLYFDSDRDLEGAFGDADIYVADRENVADEFGRVRHFANLSTEFEDEDVWVSDDGCYVVFSSNRHSDGGDQDLYEGRRSDCD